MGNTYSSTDLITLNGIRRRVDRFVFDVLDNNNSVVGNLQPSRDRPANVSVDTSRGIMRTLTGIHVDAVRQLGISTVSARVRPAMVLQDGSSWPLGVFLFGDASRPRRSWGLELDATMVDPLYILSQPVGRYASFPAGTVCTSAALQLAQEVIFTPYAVTASTQTTGVDKAYTPDQSRQAIINDLLTIAGYFPVYFDNSGVMTFRPAPAATVFDSPTFDYEPGGRIIKDSIIESDDLLTAPNRYVVIDSGATASTVSASYDLPYTTPNSIVNRGFAVTKVIRTQGVQSNDAAFAAAVAAAQADARTFRTVSFKSTHDPRHDTFDLVRFLGNVYRELSWSVDLRAGAQMSHKITRVYEYQSPQLRRLLPA